MHINSFHKRNLFEEDVPKKRGRFLEPSHLFLQEQAKIPFKDQNTNRNIEIFQPLLDLARTKSDFISLLGFLYSCHFRGSYRCLNATIRKLETCRPGCMDAFKERYLFEDSASTLNMQAISLLVSKKTKKIASAIHVIDEDDLPQTIEKSVRRGAIKQAFIVVDTELSPPHYYTLCMEKEDHHIDLFLGESVAADKYLHLSFIYLKIQKLSVRINSIFFLYHYKYARQKDICSCPHFAINDAVQFLKMSHFFASMPKPSNPERVQTIEVEEIPPKLMKYIQFSKTALYHTYETLLEKDPEGASMVGRYLTEEFNNEHALIKRKRALSLLLKECIQEKVGY